MSISSIDFIDLAKAYNENFSWRSCFCLIRLETRGKGTVIRMNGLKIVSVLFFFSLSAVAGEQIHLPKAGKLEYTKRFSYEQKRTNEVVVVMNDAGKARLIELRKDDFACEYKGRETYLCWKIYNQDLTLDPNMEERVHQHFTNQNLIFSALEGSPEPIAEGDSYAEYRIPQKVSWNGTNYESYRYGILGNDLHKIFIGEPARDGLVVNADGSFEQYLQMRKQVSKNIFEQYVFFGIFR